MATAIKTITRGGKRFMLVPEKEYRRMAEMAEMLSLPPANKDGTRPALPSIRAVLANSIIRDRKALGWTQAELARQASIPVETLNRIERGKTTADQSTIEKIEKALG